MHATGALFSRTDKAYYNYSPTIEDHWHTIVIQSYKNLSPVYQLMRQQVLFPVYTLLFQTHRSSLWWPHWDHTAVGREGMALIMLTHDRPLLIPIRQSLPSNVPMGNEVQWILKKGGACLVLLVLGGWGVFDNLFENTPTHCVCKWF